MGTVEVETNDGHVDNSDVVGDSILVGQGEQENVTHLDLSTAQVGDELATVWGVMVVYEAALDDCDDILLKKEGTQGFVNVYPDGVVTTVTTMPPIVLGWWKDGKVHRERPEEEVELLPCPFCGDKPMLDESTLGYGVVCMRCSMGTRDNDWRKDTAIEMWNTRAQPKS